MSSLAEQALEHARLRMAGQPQKMPTSRVAKISTALTAARPVSLEVVIEGPINHFMFLEGRAWAVDMVKALRASPAAEVIDRLALAMIDRPGSYSAGIQSIVKALKGEERG